MSLLMAFSIVLIILAVGDVISAKTKAFIPSVFVAALLFLFGFWTFFPGDIVAQAGFQTPVVYLSMYLLITHMGTLLSVKRTGSSVEKCGYCPCWYRGYYFFNNDYWFCSFWV